ncbi:MAG: outer membrane lipoprotein-sorting protein [Elusimicrobiota bacterium]
MKRLLSAGLLLLATAASAAEPDIHELVDRANKALRGDSSRGRLVMTIETPEWKRSLEVEGWNKDRAMAFIVIRAPAKERGETTLRRKNEMWVWLPKVERVIKIPPTMMHSAWQGSDFTYEDIVKADSIVKDYTHKLLSTKKEEGRTVYHIEAIPKPDAPVVWGKIITDVALYDDQSVVGLLEEDYSERGELIRTITLSDIKILGGRRVPARLECVPASKKGQRTILQYKELEFDLPLADDFFSYQRLQKGGR